VTWGKSCGSDGGESAERFDWGGGRSVEEASEFGTLSAEEGALREQLVAALQGARGSVAAVARVLGKSPAQVRLWLRRFGMDPDDYRWHAGSATILPNGVLVWRSPEATEQSERFPAMRALGEALSLLS